MSLATAGVRRGQLPSISTRAQFVPKRVKVHRHTVKMTLVLGRPVEPSCWSCLDEVLHSGLMLLNQTQSTHTLFPNGTNHALKFLVVIQHKAQKELERVFSCHP